MISGTVAIAIALLVVSGILVNEAKKASLTEAIRLAEAEQQRLKSEQQKITEQQALNRIQREVMDQSQRMYGQQRQSESIRVRMIVLEREFTDKTSYRAKVVISNVDLRYNGKHGQSHIWFGHIVDVTNSNGTISISTRRQVGTSVESTNVELDIVDNRTRSEIASALGETLSAWRSNYQ